MNEAAEKRATANDKLETWAWRFFLGGVFGITFSIAVGQTLLGLSALTLTAHRIRTRQPADMPRITWIAILFVVIAVLTAIVGVNPSQSIYHLKGLFWLVTIPLGATLARTDGRERTVLKSFALGGGVQALYIFTVKTTKAWRGFQAGEAWAPDVGRALIHVGSMTRGEILMVTILAAIGVVFLARQDRQAVWGWIVLLTVQILALVLNLKRGAWFCTSALAGVFLAGRLGWKGLAAVGTAVLLALAVPTVRTRLADLRREFSSASGGRGTMWLKAAPGLIRAHPWGVGYGALSNDLMRRHAPEVERDRGHVHCNGLQVLVETGWAGFAVYSVWMVWAVVNGLRRLLEARRRTPAHVVVATSWLLMLLGLLGHGLVEYNFGDSELLIILAAIMGIGGRQHAEKEAIP